MISYTPEQMSGQLCSSIGASRKLLTMSWISRTPSERSFTSEDIGGYPLASSFVFNLLYCC